MLCYRGLWRLEHSCSFTVKSVAKRTAKKSIPCWDYSHTCCFHIELQTMDLGVNFRWQTFEFSVNFPWFPREFSENFPWISCECPVRTTVNFSKASVKTGVRSAVIFSATLKPINNRCVFVIGVAILGGQKIHGKFTGNSRRFSRMILDWIFGLDFERSENSRKIHRKFTEEIHRKIHRKFTRNSRGRQLKHFTRPGTLRFL